MKPNQVHKDSNYASQLAYECWLKTIFLCLQLTVFKTWSVRNTTLSWLRTYIGYYILKQMLDSWPDYEDLHNLLPYLSIPSEAVGSLRNFVKESV